MTTRPENIDRVTPEHIDPVLESHSSERARVVSTPQKLRPVVPLPPPHNDNGESELPLIFDFLDYREFLSSLQQQRKQFGRPASNAYFARKGGIDSPNYWGLVLSGKRNLSQQTAQKFAKAAGLKANESLYFEALVFFNQAKENEEKKSYFERLQLLMKGRRSKAFDLLNSQIESISHWYVVAIRELVSTKDFSEDATWITKRLRHKITVREVKNSIDTLLRAGFLKRNAETGNLEQSEAHLVYREQGANFAIRNLHQEFISKAFESLNEDPVEHRNFSGSTLSIDSSRFDEIKRELVEFTNHLSRKFGDVTAQSDSVIQINTQLGYLTELPQKAPARKEKL